MRNLIFVFFAAALFILAGCRLFSDSNSNPIIKPDDPNDPSGTKSAYRLVLSAAGDTIFSESRVGLTAKLTKTEKSVVSDVKFARITFSILGNPGGTRLGLTEGITGGTGEISSLFSADLLPGLPRQSFFVVAKYDTLAADTVEIVVIPRTGGADERSLMLTYSPFVINADGTSASEITATLYDVNGILVPGERINFTTTSGKIQLTQPTTNEYGQARVLLVNVPRDEKALVTAHLASDPRVMASVEVAFSGESLVLTTANDTVYSGINAAFRAKLTRQDGPNVSPIKFAEISFSVLGNPSNAKIEPAKNRTCDEGETFTLFSANLPQGIDVMPFFVIATYGSIADTTKIVVSSRPEDAVGNRRLSLIANPFIIDADGVAASTITATLTDTVSGLVVPNERVNFTTNGGRIIPTQPITNAEGVATIQLVGAQRNMTARVLATLHSDQRVIASVPVEFRGMTLTSRASKLNLTGINDSITITSTLRDAASKAVFGEDVNFEARGGLNIIGSENTTDIRGEAWVRVSGDGAGVRRSDTVVISSAGVRDTVVINYSMRVIRLDTTGRNNTYRVSESGSDGAKKYTRARVSIFAGNGVTPVPNVPVSISVSSGGIRLGTHQDNAPPITAFSPSISVTNHTGFVDFTILNPEFSGDVVLRTTVTATDGEITDKTDLIYINAGNLCRTCLRVTASPITIAVGGNTSTITATATDTSGNFLAGERIFFTITENTSGSGHLEPASAVTDQSGQAIVSFVSGSAASSVDGVKIRASSESGGGILSVNTAGITVTNNISGVSLSHTPARLSGALFNMDFDVVVQNAGGNPIADGAEVTFSHRIIGWSIWLRTWVWRGTTVEMVPAFRTLLFDDYNFNYFRDHGEGTVTGYPLARGEQTAMFGGDDSYRPEPRFVDFNGNGRRDYMYHNGTSWIQSPGYDWPVPWYTARELTGRGIDLEEGTPAGFLRALWHYPDYPTRNPVVEEGDYIYYPELYRRFELSEPQYTPGTNTPNWSSNNTSRLISYHDSIGRGYYKDMDWDGFGDRVSKPHREWNAVAIDRMVTTTNGEARTTLTYGAIDAGHLGIEVWAEVGGVRSNVIRLNPLPAPGVSDMFRRKGNLWRHQVSW